MLSTTRVFLICQVTSWGKWEELLLHPEYTRCKSCCKNRLFFGDSISNYVTSISFHALFFPLIHYLHITSSDLLTASFNSPHLSNTCRRKASIIIQSSPVIRRTLAYTVRHSVVPIYPSLITVTLHSSVRTTLVYNDTKYLVPFVTS